MPTPAIAWSSLSRHALLAALAVALAGCGLTRPTPVKQTYLLEAQPAAQAAQATAAAPKPFALKVGTITVAAPFRGRTLVYRETDIKYEADFYSEYFVAPAAMLTEATTSWLASAGLFREVLPGASTADGDYLLEGFVSELVGDFRDTAKPAAVIRAKFFLSDTHTLGGGVVWNREFTQRVALRERSPDAVATGLNQALTALLADLSRELAAVNLK